MYGITVSEKFEIRLLEVKKKQQQKCESAIKIFKMTRI